MRKVGSYICDTNSNTNHEIGMKLLAAYLTIYLVYMVMESSGSKTTKLETQVATTYVGGPRGMGGWEFGGELHNCASYLSEILKKLNENKKN
jgi:hypothetical protein